ncbi:MAG: hypothetical protein ABIE36_03610 [Candidatus Diapherotrites archaeon]
MNLDERKYFERMSKYSPRNIISNSVDSAAYITYFSLMIANIAKDALSEEISPNNAKKEISDLLDNIKQLKKGVEQNV